MARPKKVIDVELLKKMSHIHCTMSEMASMLNVSVDTLENRFSEVIKSARENGKMSLRRKLFEMALGGNLGAIIWLSKQHLGMTDKNTQEFKGELKVEGLEKKSDQELLEEIAKLAASINRSKKKETDSSLE